MLLGSWVWRFSGTEVFHFYQDQNKQLPTNPNTYNLINPVICNLLQVGNKSDLLRARQVPADEGEALAASLGGAPSSTCFPLITCQIQPFCLEQRNALSDRVPHPHLVNAFGKCWLEHTELLLHNSCKKKNESI